jgi:hypothetical protein
MSLIDFAGTLSSLDHMIHQAGHLPPHIVFVTAGRSKGNQVSGAKVQVDLCSCNLKDQDANLTCELGETALVWRTQFSPLSTEHTRLSCRIPGKGDAFD